MMRINWATLWANILKKRILWLKSSYLAETNFSKENSAGKMLEQKNFDEVVSGNSGQN